MYGMLDVLTVYCSASDMIIHIFNNMHVSIEGYILHEKLNQHVRSVWLRSFFPRLRRVFWHRQLFGPAVRPPICYMGL